jgi:hypothetical protein
MALPGIRWLFPARGRLRLNGVSPGVLRRVLLLAHALREMPQK